MNLTDSQKRSFARQAVLSYQNQMVERYGDDYTLTYDQLAAALQLKNPNFFFEVGKVVGENTSVLTQRRLREAMERVAYKSTPSKLADSFAFIDGIATELAEFDFSLFGEVGIEIAQDIQKESEKIIDESKKTIDYVGDISSKALEDSGISSLFTGIVDATKGIGNTLSFAGKNLTTALIIVFGALVIFGFGWLKKNSGMN